MNFQSHRINKEACEWIARLHGAHPSPEDVAALRVWMQQSPQHKAELRRMAARWDELNVLTEIAVPVESPRLLKFGKTSLFLNLFGRRAVAGVLAVVAAVGLVSLLWPQVSDVDKDAQSSIYFTAIGQQNLVTLPDGSTALLNTNTQLRVDYRRGYRNVYLTQGEAYFDVSSDPMRPFRVFAGNSMVRAVGTAFSIHLKKKVVAITVTEGSVQINAIQDQLVPSVNTYKNLAMVKSGQSAIFDQAIESIESIQTIDDSEISRKLSWQDGVLRFSGDPLEMVLEEVSRYTHLKIEIADPDLRDLRVGGIFEVGDTEKMFEALQKGFGVHVERIDESFVLLSFEAPTSDDR